MTISSDGLGYYVERLKSMPVRSRDGKLREGMTIADAEKKGEKIIKLFNSVDSIERDGVLSKKEIVKYNKKCKEREEADAALEQQTNNINNTINMMLMY